MKVSEYFFNLSIKKQNIIIGIFTTIIMLIICEFILRINNINSSYGEDNIGYYKSLYSAENAKRIHTYLPKTKISYHRKEFTSEIETNSLGFNDREWSLNKEKFRAIVLGDSFTEGFGSSFDSNFCSLLGQKIDTVEVLNCGISGSDPYYGKVLLEEILYNFDPDMVIHCINESDISDVIIRGGAERFQQNGKVVYRKAPKWEWIYQKFYVVRLFVHSALGFDWRLLSKKQSIKEVAIAEQKIFECVKSIAQQSKEKGIRYVAVFHPSDFEFILGDTMQLNSVMQQLEEKGVEVFDMMAFLKTKGGTQKITQNYYWRFDKHHNNKGYDLFAEGLVTLFIN